MQKNPTNETERTSKSTIHPPLCGVVSRSNFTAIRDTVNYRRYVGSLSTSCVMLMQNDFTTKPIMYEVGLRSANWQTVFAPIDVNYQVEQTVNTNAIVAVNLISLHKRYSIFSGSFDAMDLSAIGYQLGKALGWFANTGELTTEMIRGGMPWAIIPLSHRDDPISASRADVFIPRDPGYDLAPGVFYALAAAANASGANVVTDMVIQDGAGRIMITPPVGVDLAKACIGGIRILMSLYDKCNAGSVMGYAFLKGLHSAATVVGHTDEGAFFRRVLRRGGFVTSFGGITAIDVKSYSGIPMPATSRTSTVVSIIDGMLLVTAGLVALSEPTTLIGGRAYPSIYTSNERTVEGRRIDLTNQICLDNSKFTSKFASLISQVFEVSSGEEVLVENSIRHSFESLYNVGDRHLSNTSVSPWFWIEPTSLFKAKFTSDAITAGFGYLAGVEESSTMDLFPSYKKLGDFPNATMASFEMRSARTVGFLVHANGHARDGTAYVLPSQFVSDQMTLVGGRAAPSAKLRAREHMDRYLWVRGQSSLCAPSEVLYTGQDMGAYILTNSYDEAHFTFTPNHVPKEDELGGKLTMRASRPAAIGNNVSNRLPRDISSRRCAASEALANARMRAMHGHNVDYGVFVFNDGPVLHLDDTEDRVPMLDEDVDGSDDGEGDNLPEVKDLPGSSTDAAKVDNKHAIAVKALEKRIGKMKAFDAGVFESKETKGETANKVDDTVFNTNLPGLGKRLGAKGTKTHERRTSVTEELNAAAGTRRTTSQVIEVSVEERNAAMPEEDDGSETYQPAVEGFDTESKDDSEGAHPAPSDR